MTTPTPATLPPPDYEAGSKGMLDEDCYSRATVLALLAAERERCTAEVGRLRALHAQVQFVLTGCVPMSSQQREVWPELVRLSARADIKTPSPQPKDNT